MRIFCWFFIADSIPENALLTSSIVPQAAISPTGTVLRARIIPPRPGVWKYDSVITGERIFFFPIWDMRTIGSTRAGWFGKTITGLLVSKTSWFLIVIRYLRERIREKEAKINGRNIYKWIKYIILLYSTYLGISKNQILSHWLIIYLYL